MPDTPTEGRCRCEDCGEWFEAGHPHIMTPSQFHPVVPDTPTPTREEVVAAARAAVLDTMRLGNSGDTAWNDAPARASHARAEAENVAELDAYVAALAALAPDPWAEADAVWADTRVRFVMTAAITSEEPDRTSLLAEAARYRRAAQRARGVPVTEDGR